MSGQESGPNSPQANADSVSWNVRYQLISAITNAAQAVITTQEDHGYSTGIYVLVNVPPSYGMTLNNVMSRIIVLSPTTFQTNIDTSLQVAFSPLAPGTQSTLAQVSPISGLFYNATPGSPSGNPLGS
jgi:hypothetical protein